MLHRICALALTAMLAMGGFAPAYADAAVTQERTEARRALVASMMDMTLSALQDQKKSFAQREEVMARGITNMVDTQWIARAVLGVAWRTATEVQREHYADLYRDYLIKMYISHFAQSSERKVSNMKLIGIDDIDEEKFSVRTLLMLSTGERLNVTYMVRQNTDGNQIIDISIEGVSLLVSHRTEFSAIAASSGVDGVIKTLERLAREEKPAMLAQAG